MTTMLKRSFTCGLAALLLCASSFAQEKVSNLDDYRYLADRINGIYIPKDIDEAVDSLDVLLGPENKRYITDSLSLDKFLAVSFETGIWIRNNWGLWRGSRLQQYFRDKGVLHPDSMSGEILEAYYKKKIQGLEYSAEEEIEPNSSGYITGTINRSGWGRILRENRMEMKGAGAAKGRTVYFQFPYGCSTAEEQQIWLSADDCKSLAQGLITDVNYGLRQIKVKLLKTLSPYGIIVFDGNLIHDTGKSFKRDFDNFTVNDPNRFYLQVGDELWFDWDSGHWKAQCPSLPATR